MSSKEKRSRREKQEKEKEREKTNIYTKVLLTRSIALECKSINSNITNTLLQVLNSTINGKCIDEGYVKQDSISIVSYSSGLVRGNNVVFEVVFECMVCHLVEGMEILCIAKNITKAGIRAELNMDFSPIVIFVARDHHYVSQTFSKVREGDEIRVKIIGQRFELNDVKICAIAELLRVNQSKSKELIDKLESNQTINTVSSASIESAQEQQQAEEQVEPEEAQVQEVKVEQKEEVKADPEEEEVKAELEVEEVKAEPEAEEVKAEPEAQEVKAEPEAQEVKAEPEEAQEPVEVKEEAQAQEAEEVKLNNELLGMETKLETKTESVAEPVKKKRGRPPKKKLVVTEDK